MKLILGLLLMGLITNVSAGIKEDIINTLSDIRRALPNSSADRSQLHNSHRKLTQALELVQGNDGGSHPPVPRSGVVKCVARDNDNAGPWVLGRRHPETLQVTKIAGTKMPDKAICMVEARNAISLARSTSIFCATRDNDGVNPWIIMAARVGEINLKINKFSSHQSCRSSLQSALSFGSVLHFCASRDNDSVGPFIQLSYVAREHQINKGSQTFSSIDDCVSNLQSKSHKSNLKSKRL